MKEPEPRRFSCVFLTTSAEDAARLNHQLSAARIRAYHAVDAREAEVLLAITSAKVLLIDIDRTFGPWLETLQKLNESHPNVPKVVLTARGPSIWSPIVSSLAFDVVARPARLGDLFGALECAHSLAVEITDPERTRERAVRVMAAIRAASQAQPSRSVWRFIRMRPSAMMDKVTHVWWKIGCHRTRKQPARA
jgi:DNA-binding NtrC family response regulator